MRLDRYGHSFALVGLLALAACNRDAAAEAPVTVKPGLYEASLSGRANSPFYSPAPGELDKKTCVTAASAENFPQKFARTYFTFDDSCGGPLAERKGNAISGKVSCPFDRSRVTGELVIAFDGTVSEESVDVAAVARIENLQGEPEDRAEIEATPLVKDGIDMKLSVRRVGDCPA